MLKLFALNLTAPQSAEFTNLNIKTINRLYGKFRERIEDLTNEISPIKGEYEADESYFGPRRVRGKQGRGVSKKTILFGLFKFRNPAEYVLSSLLGFMLSLIVKLIS